MIFLGLFDTFSFLISSFYLFLCIIGITDEDYDLFYEIWQEFDPDGTQYIDYKALSEYLDVLEAPLQVTIIYLA